MAFFKGKNKKGVVNFVETNTEELASDALDGLSTPDNPIKNVGVVNKVDFTLFDADYEPQFKIVTKQGWTFYGTAPDRKSFITKWKTARTANTGNFVGQDFFDCAEAPKFKYNFRPNQRKMYLVNVHQNGSNSDYTLATQNADIALVKEYNFNGVRNDYNASFASSNTTFAPVDGTNNAFFSFADKLLAENLFLLPIISCSHDFFTPSTRTTRYLAKLDSSGITAAEYTTLFNKRKAHGAGFATRLLPYRSIVRYIEYGSEPDVLQDRTKLLTGSGVRPMAPYQLDVNGVPVWTSTLNGTAIMWQAQDIGMLIYGMAGFIEGVLSVIPDMEFMFNQSERHYGQAITVSRDGMSLFPELFSKLTVVSPHNYSDHERGTDITGTFIKKIATTTGKFFNDTVAPDGVSMSHANIDRTYFFMINQPNVSFKKMFISETGFNVDKNGPIGGENPLTWYQNFLLDYQNDTRNLGTAFFQLKNEPISRAESTNAEKHFGAEDYAPLAAFLKTYIPPNTQ